MNEFDVTGTSPEKTSADLDPAENLTPREIEFRATLNHQLRTPLNAIIGFAELLGMRPGNDAKDPDVQHILVAARELLAVINRELTGAVSVAAKEKPEAAAVTCDVLYIEDDLVNFTLVERILEFRPALKLMHARRGEIGVDLAQAHRPKLILLDLNLPDIHGSEVLRRLQEDAATAQVPVVVLSADATPSQIERLLTAGARNYLTKPFDIDPFLAVVDEMVNEGAAAASRW